MSAPASANGNESDHIRERLAALSVALVVVTVILYAIVYWAAAPTERKLFVVAAGFAGAGGFLGFLFSAYGKEEKSLSPLMAAANGLIGGATLADLAKDDSFLRHVFHSLANAANLPPTGHGLVLSLAAAFFPIGFFTLYLIRKLDFNLVAQKADTYISEAAAKTTLLTVDTGDAGPGNDTEVAAAAQRVLKRPGVGKTGSFDDLFNDGKAFFAVGKYGDAAKVLQTCLEQRPGHPGSMLYLGGALVELKQYTQAIALLESLVQKPQAPLEAWRLLGYAYLFYPESKPDHAVKIRQSIDATTAYLKLRPDDPGAQLNLACAYGQLGPDNPESVARVRTILPALVQSSPDIKSLLAKLTGPEGDFRKWTELGWFNELIK